MTKLMKFSFSILLFALLIMGCKDATRSDHAHTNALIDETSPYLLQHAHNPVDWYPWDEEVLELARKEDKLVLVSIGYSSCHWCHVMEEETFEDEEVAALMNENFINIKVDREERPDVDQVYMTALQLLTGSGGWPLNVITLPDGKPLYGGTYHTKEEWMQVLREISTLYKESPERAREYANKVAQGIQSVNLVEKPNRATPMNREFLDRVFLNWKQTWDTVRGGQQGPQKFMLPANLNAIMEYATLTGSEEAEGYLELTLDKMAEGGVYDQLGGGFFRYSTDPEWRIPHFEKMLYDNAQLIGLYARAYKHFGKEKYRSLVAGTLDFLDREMAHPEGAYYAALDADSEGEEGRYYTWKKEELQAALGDDFERFASYYGISGENAMEDGKFVLHRSGPDSLFIQAQNLNPNTLDSLKASWSRRLMKLRSERVRPGIDDKVITSWNALLVSGLTEAYTAFGEDSYLEKAKGIYQFLQEYNHKRGRLVHTYKKGSRQEESFLEDYAYLLKAALDLYASSMDETYLDDARDYLKVIQEEYPDRESPMFRFRNDDALIASIVKTDDGVLPSPNAVIAASLLRLGHLDYNTSYLAQADAMMERILPNMERSPDLYGKWTSNLMNRVFPYYEVAIVGPDAGDLLKKFHTALYPNALLVGSPVESELPLFANRFVPGETFIYVCQNHSCKLPVTTVSEARELLR